MGVPPLSPFVLYTSLHTPNTQNTPLSNTPISVALSLVSTHFYLCSLTFSLRPDELASVWRQQKLIFNKIDLLPCFSNQEISYYWWPCPSSSPKQYKLNVYTDKIQHGISDVITDLPIRIPSKNHKDNLYQKLKLMEVQRAVFYQ